MIKLGLPLLLRHWDFVPATGMEIQPIMISAKDEKWGDAWHLGMCNSWKSWTMLDPGEIIRWKYHPPVFRVVVKSPRRKSPFIDSGYPIAMFTLKMSYILIKNSVKKPHFGWKTVTGIQSHGFTNGNFSWIFPHGFHAGGDRENRMETNGNLSWILWISYWWNPPRDTSCWIDNSSQVSSTCKSQSHPPGPVRASQPVNLSRLKQPAENDLLKLWKNWGGLHIYIYTLYM